MGAAQTCSPAPRARRTLINTISPWFFYSRASPSLFFFFFRPLHCSTSRLSTAQWWLRLKRVGCCLRFSKLLSLGPVCRQLARAYVHSLSLFFSLLIAGYDYSLLVDITQMDGTLVGHVGAFPQRSMILRSVLFLFLSLPAPLSSSAATISSVARLRRNCFGALFNNFFERQKVSPERKEISRPSPSFSLLIGGHILSSSFFTLPLSSFRPSSSLPSHRTGHQRIGQV